MTPPPLVLDSTKPDGLDNSQQQTLGQLIERLNAYKAGPRWLFTCPCCHAVGKIEVKGQAIFVHCAGRCSTHLICRMAGVALRDWFPDDLGIWISGGGFDEYVGMQ